MSTLLLFGAGASAYSGDCSPSAPPLGNTLFDELVKFGGVAGTVDSNLAQLFREDFELGMRAFREQREIDTTSFLVDMARYFVQFAPGPSNLYVKLIVGLVSARRRIILATLNYELLIELAAAYVGFETTYRAGQVSPNNISLLKPHGSCNFLPDIPARAIMGIKFSLPLDSTGAILDAPMRAVTPAEVVEFCEREDSIAPALALYARGKRPLFCRSAIEYQQAEYSAAVAKASRIYVVGARVNDEDEHIWGPLVRATSPLFYVGPDVSSFHAWVKSHRRRHTIHLATSFEKGVPEIIRHHRH